MRILTKLFGIFLMFLGIYFLGKNIYFTNSYYSGWRGLKAGSSVLLLTGGIGMLFLLPKDMKLMGYIAIGIGIILVFFTGNVFLKPTSLWQFVVSISSLTMGYKLFSSGSRSNYF